MAAPLELRLKDSGAGYTFTISGEPAETWRMEHKETGDPPPIKRVVVSWRVEEAILSLGDTATGTASTDASALLTLLANLQSAVFDRATTPITSVSYSAVGGAAIRVLGASAGFQRFRIEEFEIGDWNPPDGSPDGSWILFISCSFTVSAEMVFADADSVLDWKQRLSYNYSSGLATVTLETEAETAEGTNVETVLRAYAGLSRSTFGASYFWVTNGPEGVDVVLDDCDEARGTAVATRRSPTSGSARSVLQQVGFNVGVGTAGGSPQDYFYEVTEETSRLERVTTTVAKANGPGALAWIQSRAPSKWTSRVIASETGSRGYSGTWVLREFLLYQTVISAVLSGGGRKLETAEGTIGRSPSWRFGPFLPWEMVVDVSVDYRGTVPTNDLLPLPADPGYPWELDRQRSSEDGFARRVEASIDPAQQLWRREARLVYVAVEDPDMVQTAAKLLSGQSRPTALLVLDG